MGAFYNHSDNPNCKNVAGFWHQMPVKYLQTMRPIKAGEELTAHYTLYNDFKD
jgi:SET domain-containing protein